MNDIVHVTAVEPLDGLCIRAVFSDGAIKEIDLSGLFSGGGFSSRFGEAGRYSPASG